MTIIKEKLDLNGTETKGELDVSDCNTTKKSYFLDQSIIDAQKAEEKKKHPSPWTVTLNALKSKITDIISEPDPDNDSDDLYSISDEEE